MNPFYSWNVYYATLLRWIEYFRNHEPLYFPVSREQIQKSAFLRRATQAAVDLDMLDFHGCLDAMR